MPFPDWFASGCNEVLFLRRLLDHVSDCLIAVDTNGRVVLINEPYCRLLGEDESEVIGRHVTDVVSSKTKLHLVAKGEMVIIGAPLDVKGHQLFTRQVPVLQDGEIVGAIGTALFTDLGELKKAAALAARQEIFIKNPQPGWAARHSVSDIVGTGRVIDAARQRIRQAAAQSQPVLIQGESGTGKELAANAIHFHSDRSRRPFVWINCASMPDSLIEAELFGYEAGSFTGANPRGKRGKFELASGGTLFLDEIGDMPVHLQASLLRAIQNQEIVRVGGTTPVQVDARIICATNHPLDELVRMGDFRLDLYHRLNVLTVRMPCLRERDDLEYFIGHQLENIARRENRPVPDMSAEVLSAFLSFSWFGNVRQLQNALLRFVISGNAELDSDPVTESRKPHSDANGSGSLNLQEHLDRQRKLHIKRALQQSGNDKDEAARLLGVSRATLYRELNRVEH